MTINPNELSLAQLQSTFAQALHYQARGEDCNISSDTFTADERMQIYRNNFIISLSEVLEATYPMLYALLGAECFAQLARQHVLNHPLECGDVSHYGEQFEQTLEQFPSVLSEAPYCLDVARYEWQIDLAQQRHNQVKNPQDLLPLEQLSQLSAEQHQHLRLHLKPGVLAFQSSYSLFSLQQAIEKEDFSNLTLDTPQQGVIVCTSDAEVWTLALEMEAYQLLTHLESGCVLGEIPPEQLTYINTLAQHDLIAGFSLAV